MANFEVIEQEGVRLIKVTLQNDTVRTESSWSAGRGVSGKGATTIARGF
jgi:hypothetical protein